MRARLKWHRTMTIAAAAALIGAVLVHQREVTLLTMLTEDGARSWGWVAVVVVGLLSFACGASFRSAPPTTVQFKREDERD
jgi:uncharacterized membrane protein HdeD (DUF308 family)